MIARSSVAVLVCALCLLASACSERSDSSAPATADWRRTQPDPVVLARVVALVQEMGGYDGRRPSGVAAETRLDRHLDDLALVELILAIEEEYEIEIADEDALGWSTVGDVARYVSSRRRLVPGERD